MIKLHNMGIKGKFFNWIMDFLKGISIQIKVGTEISSKHKVENGTPQGSVVSPTFFSVMINDIFAKVPTDM